MKLLSELYKAIKTSNTAYRSAAGIVLAGLGYPASGTSEIVILNGFFIALWVGSAWLFRNAARKQAAA